MEDVNKAYMQQAVQQHSGLVKVVARKLAKVYGEDEEDLIQIGYIGLMKAVQRFEPERGLQFSTYAVPLITGEIKMQMRDQGSIKMSRSLKTDVYKVRKAESDYLKIHGTSPHIKDLEKETGLTAERIREVLQASDAMMNMEDYEESDVWTDSEEKYILKMDINRALEALSCRERQVIMLRYYKDMTQKQVADQMKISQVQVSRIEKRTLQRIGNYFHEKP